VLGLADPPREEAKAAVAACRSAGIGVTMITGDHAVTARAIGAQLGLADAATAVTGADIEQLSDADLAMVTERARIFARAAPEHKLRLVQAMQSRGAVIAMTGDGVNDAPALRRADVGVAMGRKGTDAAKEAAEMVLADDNFASIVAAVEEGRTVYDNLRKAIVFILPTNGGEAGMVLIAILLGMVLPITPVQILWVNMITAVTLALAIAFEQPEADIMRRPPRDPREPLLSGFLIWRIAFVSALLVAGSLGLFLWEEARGATLEVARTAAVNVLVVGEIAYLFNCRHLRGSVLSLEGLLGNRWVLNATGVLLAFQLAFTYLPPVQSLFGTAAIDLAAWSRIAAFGLCLFLIVEAEKQLMRRLGQ
jgi:magnesium-transporting ATPase (P-type)